MTTTKTRVKLLTPKARLRYSDLFKARAQEAGQAEKFSLVLLFSPEAQATPEYAALRAEAQRVAIEKFGDALKDPTWASKFRSPFRKAEEKVKLIEGKMTRVLGFEDGWTFASASSPKEHAPGVVQHTAAGTQRVIDENDIYNGCWVLATLTPFAYDTKGNYGVSLGLNNVMKVADDTPFPSGGKGNPEDDFAGVSLPPATTTAAPGGTASPGSLFL
jgi:hypothetical protein